MLKRTITYKDYNETERTEDFYFNLTQAEVTEMALSVGGGYDEMLKRIIAAQDGAEIIKQFKDILFRSYGEKSPDGKRFIKSEELSNAFSQTEAYNILFVELLMDPEAAAKFINSVIPQKVEDKKS